MKKLFLLIALTLSLGTLCAQTVVTIGTGTLTARRPFGMYFGYERTAMLFTAAEIGNTGNITDLGWYIQTLSSAANGPVKIYLKTTTSATLTADTWANLTTAATLVYDNATTTFSAGGWQTFSLSTPFAYGGDNLLVLVETNFGGGGGETSSGKAIRYTSATGTMLTWSQDNTVPTGNGTTSSTRPNIQISFSPSVALDAGVNQIVSPTTPVSVGLNNIAVSLKNYGIDAITTAAIAWKVNGILQTPYTWNGSLASGTAENPVTIGSYDFTTPGTHLIKVWSENPNGGTDANNVNDTTTKSVYVQGYASIPFIEDFDNTWIDKLGTREVPSGYWNNTPTTGNQSWRRDDDGASAGWSSPTAGIYSPTGANSTTHSAKFHTYYAPDASIGILDLYLDFSPVGIKILKFNYINPSGDDSLSVYISNDGGNNFTYLQKYLVSASWTENTINLGSSVSPTTVLRFKANSDYGLDDIGIDRVKINILQANDITAVEWVSPVTGCGLTGTESVVVKFTNSGTDPQSNVSLVYSIDEGVTLVGPEFYAGPINPGDTITFTFAQTSDFSQLGEFGCGFIATAASDGDQSNDTVFTQITNSGIINNFPFIENFDSGSSNYLTFSANADAAADIENTIGNQNTYGVHFQGATGTGWSGTGTIAAADAWGVFTSHHATAAACGVDATSLSSLKMTFDLRQTYSYNNTYNWFAVIVNGTDTLTDEAGTKYFHPITSNSDAYATKSFDLSAYAGSSFSLEFKSSCKYNNSSGSGGVGDNVYFDKLVLYQPSDTDAGVAAILSPLSSLCGNTMDSVLVIVSNYGVNSLSNINVYADITTPGGIVNLTGIYSGTLADGESDTLYLGTINTTAPGNYVCSIYTVVPGDTIQSNDSIVELVITRSPIALPHSESFEGTTPLSNWNTNFTVGNGHYNTSNVLFRNLYSGATSATAIFKEKIGAVNANSYISFDYRITEYIDGSATTLNKDSIFILISDDCGENFSYIYLIDSLNHMPDTLMKHVVIPIGALAGSNIIPAIYAQWDAGDYYLDIDNFSVSDAPVVNLGADQATCEGVNVVLDAGASPAGYTYSYIWSTLLHPTIIATAPIITTDSAATYIVTVNNGYGLSASDTIVITVNPSPVVSLGSDVSGCVEFILDAGAGYDSYLWSNGDIAQTTTVTASGDVWVEVQNTYNCSAYDTINVTIIPLPIVNAGADETICIEDDLLISLATAANFDSLLWTSAGDGHFNDSTLLLPVYYPGIGDTTNGSVQLTLTAYALCDTVSSSFTLYFSNNVAANAGDDVSICLGSSTVLNAVGGTSYSWSPSTDLSATDIPNPVANPASTTTYTVSVTGSCGSATDEVTVTVDEIVEVNLGIDTTTCAELSVILDAGVGYDSYLWSNGATTQTITVDTVGIGLGAFTYYVDVTNGTCQSSDTVIVSFNVCVGINESESNNSISLIPNPSTGLFNLSLEGINGKAILEVYSLHGQLVYSEEMISDGTYHKQYDFTSFTKGVYIVKLNGVNVNAVEKLVIE